MGDPGRAADGAAAAAHAVEGFLGALFQLAPLGVGDVLHHVQALGAGLGAGIAADAGVDLRVQLHHHPLVGLQLFNFIGSLVRGEEGDGGHIHALLNLGLAGQAGFQLILSLDAVDGGAGSAEAVAAAAAPSQGISGVFHGGHNGQIAGHGIFLAEKIDVNHFFHHSGVSF